MGPGADMTNATDLLVAGMANSFAVVMVALYEQGLYATTHAPFTPLWKMKRLFSQRMVRGPQSWRIAPICIPATTSVDTSTVLFTNSKLSNPCIANRVPSNLRDDRNVLSMNRMFLFHHWQFPLAAPDKKLLPTPSTVQFRIVKLHGPSPLNPFPSTNPAAPFVPMLP